MGRRARVGHALFRRAKEAAVAGGLAGLALLLAVPAVRAKGDDGPDGAGAGMDPTTAGLVAGRGDGSVRVVVDAFGSFGHNLYAGGAEFDPPGPTPRAQTVFSSGLYLSSYGSFLGHSFLRDVNGPVEPPDFVDGERSSDRWHTSFGAGGVLVDLDQRVVSVEDVGARLIQEYRLENPGDTALDLVLVRYVDGDLYFQANFEDDWGGVSADHSTLFEYDSGDNPFAPTTFVGITSEGIERTAFTIQQYPFFGQIVQSGEIPGPARDQVLRDGNDDLRTDEPYDIILALEDRVSLPPGGTATYTTTTLFGTQTLGTADFLDPAPGHVGPDGEFAPDLASLAASDALRRGATADGVTRLAIRIPALSDTTFSLASGDFADGWLSTLESPGEMHREVTVRPRRYGPDDQGPVVALALWHAPDRFEARPSTSRERVIGFTAENEQVDIDFELVLRRPPVLLVPDPVEGPEGWPQAAVGFLSEAGFGEPGIDILRVDPGPPGAALHPDLPAPANVPVGRVRDALHELRARRREDGIATARVDVVAHGTGGVLVRAVPALAAHDARPADAWGAPEVRKLVTLGTPHLGSSVAGWLAARGVPFHGDLAALGLPAGRAARDLAPGSDALAVVAGVEETMPPRAIPLGGTAANGSATGTRLETLLELVAALEGETSAPSLDELLCGAGGHDAFSRLASQLAGRDPAASMVPGVVHAALAPEDTGETASSAAHGVLLAGLRQAPDAARWGPLDGEAPGLCLEDLAPLGDGLPAGEAPVELVLPGPGAAAAPGEPLSLSVRPDEGTGLAGAWFALERAGDDLPLAALDAPPWEAELVVPARAAGRLEVLAAARDTEGRVRLGRSWVAVTPGTPPASIEAVEVATRLVHAGDPRRLHVRGLWPDGSTRLLGGPGTGIEWAVEGDGPGAVEVTGGGVVTARAEGTAVVVATHESVEEPARFEIVVEGVNAPPALEAPAEVVLGPGAMRTLEVAATDPDGDALSLDIAAAPAFVSFRDEGGGQGTLGLEPGPEDLGVHEVILRAFDDGTPVLGDGRFVRVVVSDTPGGVQRPGDCNGDGQVNLSDPICVLSFLFIAGGDPLPCGDGQPNHPANVASFDANGDGTVSLSDPIWTLAALFQGGPPPVPGLECEVIPDCPDNSGACE